MNRSWIGISVILGGGMAIAGSVLAQEPGRAASSAAAAQRAGSSSSAMALLDSESFSTDLRDKPTYIKAERLSLDSRARVFTYASGVEVQQGDLTLTCDALQGKYTEKNQIETMVAGGNVVITKGPTIRATSQKAIYDAAAQTITLTESPELQESESVLTADTVKIFLQEDRSAAEGQVRVKVVRPEEKPGGKEKGGEKAGRKKG